MTSTLLQLLQVWSHYDNLSSSGTTSKTCHNKNIYNQGKCQPTWDMPGQRICCRSNATLSRCSCWTAIKNKDATQIVADYNHLIFFSWLIAILCSIGGNCSEWMPLFNSKECGKKIRHEVVYSGNIIIGRVSQRPNLVTTSAMAAFPSYLFLESM